MKFHEDSIQVTITVRDAEISNMLDKLYVRTQKIFSIRNASWPLVAPYHTQILSERNTEYYILAYSGLSNFKETDYWIDQNDYNKGLEEMKVSRVYGHAYFPIWLKFNKSYGIGLDQIAGDLSATLNKTSVVKPVPKKSP
jgi:hypothetical protein